MNNLKVGDIYTNGILSREITDIKGRGEIYYKTEKNKSGHCWITTFQDWIRKGEKSKETISYKYEIAYTKNGEEYITTDNINDLKTATDKLMK